MFYDRIIFNQEYIEGCICEHIEHLFRSLLKMSGSLLNNIPNTAEIFNVPAMTAATMGTQGACNQTQFCNFYKCRRIVQYFRLHIYHFLINYHFLSIHFLTAHQIYYENFSLSPSPSLFSPCTWREYYFRIKNEQTSEKSVDE